MNTRLLTDPVVECLLIAACLSLAFWPKSAVSQVPKGWEPVRFEGETAYHFDGDCWRALADGSASGLAHREKVDLDATPYLRWQWRAATVAEWPNEEERSKAGDDFQARVYVIKKGWLPWQTRAINYVWSRQYPPGSHWPNPFASQAHMVVVQGPGPAQGWQSFSRNVRDDFRRYHGTDVHQVDAVAIMTDGDNTGATVSACYRLPAFQVEP